MHEGEFGLRSQVACALIQAAISAGATRQVAAGVAAALFRLALASCFDAPVEGDGSFVERMEVINASLSTHRKFVGGDAAN